MPSYVITGEVCFEKAGTRRPSGVFETYWRYYGPIEFEAQTVQDAAFASGRVIRSVFPSSIGHTVQKLQTKEDYARDCQRYCPA